MPLSDFQIAKNALRFFDLRRGSPHTFAAASRPGAAFRLPAPSAMKPAPFRYIAATSLEHALSLKAEHGDDAKFLAGGQSLIPTMNFRLARPAVLIDINEIRDLAGIRPSAAATRVGPLTRYRALQRDAAFARLFPLIGEALPHIAHPQIRNRGTIGGNLSHADPASELPAIALALGARFHARTATQQRWIAASDFFVSALTTDLKPDEMLGETPVDASSAADVVVGSVPSEDAIRDVAAIVQTMIAPNGSVHATADYQRHIAGVLTERALQTAYARGRDGH